MNIPAFFSTRKKPKQTPLAAPVDASSETKINSLITFLTRYYAWILLLAAVIIVIEQTREHLIAKPGENASFYVFYGEIVAVLVLLSLIGLLVRVLLSTLSQKTRALNILNVKHDFIQQLSASQDIPEVSKSLARQITLIIPSANIELFIHEHAKDWFIRVNHPVESPQVSQPVTAPANLAAYPCSQCILKNNHVLHSLENCQHREEFLVEEEQAAGFCLPLVYGNIPVGLLLLYLPDGQNVDDEQSELLSHLSTEMAQAIGMLIEKKAREEARLSEKLHTMQLDIARDLHDTVGQNISYLRMKLDHLSETDPQGSSDLILEIRSMSKVANESYDLVRGTLAVLQADDSADLLYLFSRYAEQVAERSSFEVEFSTCGKPRSLTAVRMRHLFYIFREALSNIEKHAQSNKVNVKIAWEEKHLNLTISDNGKGYDPARTQKLDVHYGLKFMRERATLLDGTLSVKSREGSGTTLYIIVPYD